MIPSFNVRDAYPSLADYNHANGLFLMVGRYYTLLLSE